MHYKPDMPKCKLNFYLLRFNFVNLHFILNNPALKLLYFEGLSKLNTYITSFLLSACRIFVIPNPCS
ncbi:uncharacterized protein F4812DRAFT_415185 [Daldinia caldariorum]|uniref:uncharacterized protein n=1 Tax=Daldinia caldariorum TaxID=326644 RepID=UPI0020079717|nr:uncharacterized protein F4812DRAFT_415185 [Daldinia caldariorum]KAI1471709.1 hypothetical protein F4812DRAFT_415185 [Daldinia caldariorum]